jgi:uncharacterized membrane protein HdeD (DUF308 family)
MNRRLARGLFMIGFLLVAASAFRALVSLVRMEQFDPWALVLVVGCLSLTVGMGMLGSRGKTG